MFVILEVCFQNAPQRSFIENDQVVQALTPQRADEALRKRSAIARRSALPSFPCSQLAEYALHFNVTSHPTAEWTARHIAEAF